MRSCVCMCVRVCVSVCEFVGPFASRCVGETISRTTASVVGDKFEETIINYDKLSEKIF